MTGQRERRREREEQGVCSLCGPQEAPSSLPPPSLLPSGAGAGPGAGWSQCLSQARPLGLHLALGLKLILSGFQGSSRHELLLSLQDFYRL